MEIRNEEQRVIIKSKRNNNSNSSQIEIMCLVFVFTLTPDVTASAIKIIAAAEVSTRICCIHITQNEN